MNIKKFKRQIHKNNESIEYIANYDGHHGCIPADQTQENIV